MPSLRPQTLSIRFSDLNLRRCDHIRIRRESERDAHADGARHPGQRAYQSVATHCISGGDATSFCRVTR